MILDELLKKSLKKFYSSEHNRKKLISVLSNDTNISLRSIDWFITNYSKKNNTYYLVYETANKIPSFNKHNIFRNNMNVYHSYKSQLKAYSKQKFDPFCRRDRILFELDDETSVETTIGQLNFFRWAISNLILDYIEEHKDIIEDDMNTCLKTIKKHQDKKKGSRKKRQELSLSATRGLNKNHITVELEFN